MALELARGSARMKKFVTMIGILSLAGFMRRMRHQSSRDRCIDAEGRGRRQQGIGGSDER